MAKINVLVAGGKEDFKRGRIRTGDYAALTLGNGKLIDGKFTNQDGVLVATSGNYTILAVADGVSGSKNGHLGAKHALEGLANLDLSKIPPTELDNIVPVAFQQINKTMVPGASTTLQAAVVWNGHEYGGVKVYSLGDGHIVYRLANSSFPPNTRYLTIPGHYSSNAPFQMSGEPDDTKYINHVKITTLLPFWLVPKDNKDIFIPLNNTFPIKAGDELLLATDGIDDLCYDPTRQSCTDYTRFLEGRNPEQSIRAIIASDPKMENLKRDLNSLAAGKPDTRNLGDDLAIIVYKHK